MHKCTSVNGWGSERRADDGVDDKGCVGSAVYDVPPDSLHFSLSLTAGVS